MRLTLHSNHAMRLLMYCALAPNEVSPISAIAKANHVSENHLTKIAQCLSRMGVIETVRGRGGGVRLIRKPDEINIGAVIRKTEDNLNIAECFALQTNTCVLAPECRFKLILAEALKAFLAVLDSYTLADLISSGAELRTLLGIEAEPAQANHSSA